MEYVENINSQIFAGSLRIKVFNKIQDDILNGKYLSGESLIETKLCKELGVSRTPVREAISQLELEGLVNIVPNKGAVVSGISVKDVEDIFTIRMVIEGLAAKWAVYNISKKELEELEENLELEEFYTRKNDHERLLELDSKFHEQIYRASKSKPLIHVLTMFHHYIKKARSMSFNYPGRAKKVLNEHRAILNAFIEKDEQKAEKLMIKHIENAGKIILKNKK